MVSLSSGWDVWNDISHACAGPRCMKSQGRSHDRGMMRNRLTLSLLAPHWMLAHVRLELLLGRITYCLHIDGPHGLVMYVFALSGRMTLKWPFCRKSRTVLPFYACSLENHKVPMLENLGIQYPHWYIWKAFLSKPICLGGLMPDSCAITPQHKAEPIYYRR